MRWLLLVLALLIGVPAQAVQPDEILNDPLLEERARDISKGVRCLVCRNESIDDSNAGLARDLRLLVRERLVAGDTNDQVRAYLVDRYGEYVLLKPTFTWSNAMLWLSGPLIFLGGVVAAFTYVRRRKAEGPGALTPEEQARLDQLLKD